MTDFLINGIEPPLRDLRMTMDAPFYALEKKRSQPIEYLGRNGYVSIVPTADSHIASIWDCDIMIGLYSFLNDGKNRGAQLNNRVTFQPAPLLRCIGRGNSSRDYQRLAQGIRRLRTTTITTNFMLTKKFGVEIPFSWLQSYEIPKHVLRPDSTIVQRGMPWVVELPDWVCSIFETQRDILRVHPDYFTLKSAIARALYRTARKSVNPQRKRWTYRADTLHKRYALRSPLSRFLRKVCEIADQDHLPEYTIDVLSDGLQSSITFRERPHVKLSPIRGVYHHNREPRIIGGGKL